jgi:hypothetical protein
MKPICVPCQRFFRMKRGGFAFTEGMPRDGERSPRAGKAEAEKWKAYKIWYGDLWECKGCGAQIISGVAQQPIGEHYQDGFEDLRKAHRADQLQINDC